MNTPFLHQLPDAQALFEVVAHEQALLPSLVEKDYWLMHVLWGIQQQGFRFELKGGTSLSKGYGIIERFSEDIDICIHPNQSEAVKTGKNHTKPAHIESRRLFFESIATTLNVPGVTFSRDSRFDDVEKMRGAGISGKYFSHFVQMPELKAEILLEVGFDQTAPYLPRDISSWAFEKAFSLGLDIIDNRAKQVNCYCPEYTFVEKLQAVSTKFRLQQENKIFPINFLRHYYDIYRLLEVQRVRNFIGSAEYLAHKANRFRSQDEMEIRLNPAFVFKNPETKRLYSEEFKQKSAIYFKEQPSFEAVLERITQYIDRL